MQTYFFLAAYAFRSKVLVLVIGKKLRDPKKFISDAGGKKTPGPGSRIGIRNTEHNDSFLL
jgi:hypothetical protein